MDWKEFFKPTKGKIILFIVILILGVFSDGFKIAVFGRPLTSTEKLINAIPKFTSPGINALMRDDGFFIGYKPYGTFGMVLEGMVHVFVDLVYWYLLSCLLVFLFRKIKKRT